MKDFLKSSTKPPDYLERTTKGITVVTLFLVCPFAVYSYFMDRYLFAIAGVAFFSICMLYLWTCKKGKCNRRFVSYPVAPLLIVCMPLIIYQLGLTGVYWVFPGSIALYFLLTKKWALISNFFLISAVSFVASIMLDMEIVLRLIAVLMGVNLFSLISVTVINKQYTQLVLDAVTDPFTGLYNRSLLQQSLEYANNQYKRTGVFMSLIAMDLDYFKSINDDFGHDVGDRVLKSFSELLKQSFRGTDMIFRSGGEEFLMLVYDADKIKATTIAEKIRQKIEDQELISNRKITVSAGVAEVIPHENYNQWLKRCDQKMYQAKHAGRNQVVS